MKIKTFFIIDAILLAEFLAGRIIINLIPNSAELLRRTQENYSADGQSAIDNKWAYFIINSESPLPDNYSFSLANVQGTYLMDERCAQYAKDMIAAAEADGIKLKVISAYRSKEKQQENIEAYIEKLVTDGMERVEAQKAASFEIAKPGVSEHNAGLALDILTENWWDTHNDVTADFENTAEFEWLSEHAHEYGFILRYPKGAEKITGYAYEPWHYRFVGVYYANKIKESGLPFEYFYIGA